MADVCFDDVLLEPQYSTILTRSAISLAPGIKLTKNSKELLLPFVAAPMDTVVNAQVAHIFANRRGFAVMHRYCSPEEQGQMFAEACLALAKDSKPNVMCAIGASGDFLARAKLLHKLGCDKFCVDVAHGHHSLVKLALEILRAEFGDDVHLMAGNVATLEGFEALADWGANSIRVGIGGGSCCVTRTQTGHGVPTLQSIFDCSKSAKNALLVADGGIRNSGDAVKALAAGADLVMMGAMFAGHDESPGYMLVDENGEKRKVFRGMASREAQSDWRGSSSYAEGISTTVRCRGELDDTVTALVQGVQSGLSYSGAKNLVELRAYCKFRYVTSAAISENLPHAKML